MLECHRLEMKSYVDANEIEPDVTSYRGHEFFDTVKKPPSYPLAWYRPAPSPWMRDMILMWSFWITTLLWDTFLYFLSKPSPLPSRVRRQKQPPTIAAYPTNWLILTGCMMMLMSALQGQGTSLPIPLIPSVVTHMHRGGKIAYDRITLLDDMVVLNLDTFVQYQGLKIKAMNNILDARKPVTEEEPTIEAELTEAELDKFFDSYETLPIELGDSFFDAIDDDPYQFFDPFAFHDLCQLTSCMDCGCCISC
jgi:hypothetical protein